MKRQTPLLAATVLGAGITAGWYGGGFLQTGIFPLFLGGFFLSGLIFFIFRVVLGRSQPLQVLFPFLLVLGLLRGAGERLSADQAFALGSPFRDKRVTVVGTVVGDPSPWREGYRFPLRVEEVGTGNLALEVLPSPLRWEVFLSGPEPDRRDRRDRRDPQERRDPPPGVGVEYGDRLFLQGKFFGELSSRVTRWTRERISGGLLGKSSSLNKLGKGRVNPVSAFVRSLRSGMVEVGRRTLSPEAAGLLHGMLLGQREDLTELSADELEKAGVAHLLSVSGMHLYFWLALFLGVGRLLHLPGPLLSALSAPVVVLFILLSGARAPALRAGITALLALVGRWWRRPVRGENLLGTAASLLLLIKPLEIFAPGFWLSFAAYTGVVVLFPVWEQALGGFRYKRFLSPLLLSLAAQVGVFPLLLRFFGGASLLAPVSNLFLVPVGAAAVQVGLTAAVAGSVFLPAARLLNAGNEIILGIFRRMVKFFAGYSGYISLPPWPLPSVIAFYLLVAIITWAMVKNPVTGRRRIPLFYPLVILALVILAGVSAGWAARTDRALTVVVFDVGQGDSLLVTTPDGLRMMIDGGTAEGFARGVQPYLKANAVDRIDLLVLTHPHEDHLGGLLKMLEEGGPVVGEILDGGYPHTTRSYQRFLELVKEKGILYHRAVRGAAFRLGKLKGLVLNPPEQYLSGTGSDVNNNSVVLLLEYDSVRLLLAGDLEKEGEKELISAYGGSLRANLLKVGHHGSSGAGGEEWIARVRPEAAVISVGRDNPFGHPSPQVLNDLERSKARVFRTDRDGRLVIRVKKGEITVKRGGAE